MKSLSFNSSEPEIVSLWGDLYPPQSEPTPKQEPSAERRHIKVSWEELNEGYIFIQHKRCSKCQKKKPLIAFGESPKESYGRRNYCKECNAGYFKERYQNLSEGSRRERGLKKKFNLTLEEYDAMLEAQGGVCKSCGNVETRINPRTNRVRYLAVDHDHKTGKVRGLLCQGCNVAYGYLYEDPERIKALLAYHYKVHGENAS